jgi:hypothetical protein
MNRRAILVQRRGPRLPVDSTHNGCVFDRPQITAPDRIFSRACYWPDQSTIPQYAVMTIAMPNAIRYHAKTPKSCELM